MTKLKLLVAGVLVLGLLFSAAVVLASPAAPAPLSRPGKIVTPKAPGAVANAKVAVRGSDDQHGNGKPMMVVGPVKVFQGTVEAVGSNSLQLKLGSGDVDTFVVSDTVKINIVGVNANAKLSDVSVGSRALVQAQSGADNSLVAIRIFVFPAPKPEKIQRVGIVTAFTPGVSITIRGPSGVGDENEDEHVMTGTQTLETTFTVTTATVILPAGRASQLAVGSRVTIVAPNAAAQGGQMVAQIIIVHPAKGADVDKRNEDSDK